MAGNAIASGSAILTANADGLATGLGKAGKEITQWGQTTGTALKSSIAAGGLGDVGSGLGANLKTSFRSSIAGGLGDIGGGLGANLKASLIGGGGIGGGIGATVVSGLMKIPGPAMAAGAAILGIGETVGAMESKLEGLAKTNKMAGVLGVSASNYAGMQKVLERVGVEGDDVVGMFAKMGKNILTSSAAGEQFAKMGIDAKVIASQDLNEQFKTIAEGFTKIPKGAEQARAALEIFGKSGATLLPILQKGRTGIEELIKGESFEILSDKQYAAAGNAVKAWKAAKKDITGAWEGISDRLSVALAPVVSFVGKTVSRVMNFVSPVLDWFSRGWGQVGDIIEIVFEKLDQWFGDLGEWIDSVTADLGEFAGGWPTIENVVVRVFRALGTAGGYAFDVVAKGTGYVVEGWVLLESQLDVVVDKLVEIVHAMAKVPGSPQWFKDFDAGLDKSIAKGRAMRAEIGAWGEKQANRRFGQASDDFNAWLDRALAPKAKKPEEVKPIAGAADTAAVWTPSKLAGAIERGSKEAYSIEMRSRFGEFAKQDDVHKDNGKKLDKNTGVLERIEKQLGELKGKVDEVESM